MTTSPGARRFMLKGVLGEATINMMRMRDKALTAGERDKYAAEAARLSRLERNL
jgi:hypothetical protein